MKMYLISGMIFGVFVGLLGRVGAQLVQVESPSQHNLLYQIVVPSGKTRVRK